MFEQELELEKKESSIVPLLLIVTLIIAVVGVALYFLAQSKKVLTTAEAAPVMTTILEGRGPVMLRFQTGNLKASGNENPRDPHYQLLEKVGYLKIGGWSALAETLSNNPHPTTMRTSWTTGATSTAARDGSDCDAGSGVI